MPARGVIKRKIRVPAHFEDAVHCWSRLHDGDFMAMTSRLWFHGKGPGGFGDNVEALKDRGSCRGETEVKKRRLQAEDGDMLEVVVSRIPTQGRACVRPKRASPVSRRGYCVEPTSRDGRPAKMPSLPCCAGGCRVAWTFPGLCRR